MKFFIRTCILKKKITRQTFHDYCLGLDRDLISDHHLFVPELRTEAWYPYMEEKDLFGNLTGNIMFAKHYRYTPLFVHEHEFFEILCIYDGTAQTTIQGIYHTLHTGDVCIIPPHTKHSIGSF